ncbi:hypothetical protein CFP56_039870 [Quercus suber]|uniref:EF-hand domain-containing protein n=1 Tax=Quercus suber TaxID=58331 RepID=A0AAW0LLR8_QUESU
MESERSSSRSTASAFFVKSFRLQFLVVLTLLLILLGFCVGLVLSVEVLATVMKEAPLLALELREIETRSIINTPRLQCPIKPHNTNNDNLLSKEELKKAFEYLGSIIPGFCANRSLHHADANKD